MYNNNTVKELISQLYIRIDGKAYKFSGGGIEFIEENGEMRQYWDKDLSGWRSGGKLLEVTA